MDTKSRCSIALIVAILVMAVFVIFKRIHVSTDLSLFLPEPSTKAEELLIQQLNNGATTNLVFLALSGLEAENLAELNQTFQELLSESGQFHKISNNSGGIDLSEIEIIENNRYLLTHNDLEYQFSVEGLSEALTDRLHGLASPESVIEKQYLRNDPTGELLSLVDEFRGKVSSLKRTQELYGVWFSQDRKRSLLLVELNSSGTEHAGQVEAVSNIKRIFSAAKSTELKFSESTLIMTGPAVFAVESSQDIRQDIRKLTISAVGLVLLFLWSVYRFFRNIILIVLPLAMGVVVATAATLLVYGEIHGITLAFGVTLAGVAVDYPIHLITGLTKDKSRNINHIKSIWPTLRLGVMSTIIAYAAFILSGFSGLQQLGLFTIIGLAFAALFSRWLLPVLYSPATSTTEGLVSVQTVFKNAVGYLSRYFWIVPVSFLVVVMFLVFTPKSVMDLNVDSLSPVQDDRRKEGKLLRNDLGFWSGGEILVLTARDQETVLQNSEALQKDLDELIDQGVIAAYDMAAQFLPSQRVQADRIAQIPPISVLKARMSEALIGLPFKPGIFKPFYQQLNQSKDMPLLTLDALSDSSLGEKLSPLLFEINDEAAAVVLLHQVKDQQTVIDMTSARTDFSVNYLHLKQAATRMVDRSVDRVLHIMLGGMMVVYLLLAFSFKSFARPFKVMVPTVSAAAVVCGGLVLMNMPLSLFHLISLLLVIGLGLDYALFFNRLPDHEDEWETTFKSLWVCGITTILVFGVLAFSDIPPLQSIGITVAWGAAFSLIFAAIWAARPDTKQSA